jgi:mono/diheme cytochrome c family protein
MHKRTITSLKAIAFALTITLGFTAAALSQDAATPPPPPKKKASAPVDTSKLPPASAKKDVTYAGDIKAIFDNSCVKCHGAEKPKAGLKLDSLEAALKGAKNEKVIVPGKSADSIMVHTIAHLTADQDQWMPPPNNKAKIGPLTTDQIGLIRAWIDQGAK